MTLTDLLFNRSLCVAAIVFAAHNCVEARRCALALFVGWLLYVSAWLPLSPATVTGLPSASIWAATDSLVGLYIAEKAIDRWWGATLWASLTCQVVCHVLYINGLWAWGGYSFTLDCIFRGQVAVFVIMGWPNVRDRLFSAFDRWRHDVDTHQAISEKQTIDG